MAKLEVWMEVEAHQFDVVVSKLTWELVYMYGLQTDEAAFEEHTAKIAKVLDVYEARLSKTKYLAADAYTLACLNHLPGLKYLLDERPHVSAWCKNIMARPASAKVVNMDKQA